MADALASGASVLRDVGVQVPLRPQLQKNPGFWPGFFRWITAWLRVDADDNVAAGLLGLVHRCVGPRRDRGGTLARLLTTIVAPMLRVVWIVKPN